MTEGPWEPGPVVVRVRLPEVAVPVGDPVALRGLAADLDAAAEGLAGASWRVTADSAATRTDAAWCGVASAAYLAGSAQHAAVLARAAAALARAGTGTSAYAARLASAQEEAHQLSRLAERLVRDRDDLVAEVRRLADERRGAGLGPVASAAALGVAGQQAGRVRMLQERADRLEVEAVGVARAAGSVTDDVARASAAVVAELDATCALTRAAAETEMARRRAGLVAAGALAAEDSGAWSRVDGFLRALRDDVTGPVGMVAGLAGLRGDPRPHWAELGHAAAYAATHPGALVGAVVDRRDLDQGDWGEWLGTVGPSLVAAFASAGTYGAVRAARAADLLESQAALAAEVRRIAEWTEYAEFAYWRLDNGGRTSSVLVPGGGLVVHERAGGHALDRHVGLDVAQLRKRIRKFGLRAASTFPDRETAEQLTTQVLDELQVHVARWLAGTDRELAVVRSVGRAVGITLRRRAAVPEVAMQVKVVLVRDASPLGFRVLTSFPWL